jgi:alpha-glucuronidase
LWLRASTNANNTQITSNATSATINLAKEELQRQWKNGAVSLNIVTAPAVLALGEDGYTISGSPSGGVTVSASAEQGLLYAAFHLIRMQETDAIPVAFDVVEKPSHKLRLLFEWHWSHNFSGGSIWNMDDYLATPRLTEFVRINASIGINGICLGIIPKDGWNPAYYTRIKELADFFRPYHFKIYMQADFAAPKVSGGLNTYDPLNPAVQQWWKDRMCEFYSYVPDFGGLVIKANSEGTKGPFDYGRTQVQGANVLADALAPYGGVVLWRAFVYAASDEDRIKQQYLAFQSTDGQYRDNVTVQVKNGPLDFQPREPFSPLFGAMPKTPVTPELQITQEYMGGSDDMVYLGTMWEEFFQSDTYAQGAGSTISKITDGSLFGHQLTAIMAIGNHGRNTNWCGHHFAQANWYAFGRLAWNNTLSAETIAREWLSLTFTPNSEFVEPALDMMMRSHKAIVDYQTPLGLVHLIATDAHLLPNPGNTDKTRPDWSATYYHRADATGLGYDRSLAGSNAVSQYREPLRSQFNNINTCPERYLTWFHHVPWTYVMNSKRTFWNELCYHYNHGVEEVREFQKIWDRLKPYVDDERFLHVKKRLQKQQENAVHWRDVCLNYFRTFAKRTINYN